MTRSHRKTTCDFSRNTGIYQTLPKIKKLQDLISIPVRVTSVRARKQRNIAASELSFFLKIRFVLYLFIIHELRIFEPEVMNLLAHFYLCEN